MIRLLGNPIPYIWFLPRWEPPFPRQLLFPMEADKVGYKKTLPVLTRAWSVADPIHSDHVSDQSYPDVQTTTEQPAPPPAPAALSASSGPSTSSTTTASAVSSRNAPSKIRKPRKNNNAAAGKSTLFWVNSDPQTAAKGTKEETLKRIRSHVMSEHNRKKRIQSTKQQDKGKQKSSSLETPATDAGALVPAASFTTPVSVANSQTPEDQDPDIEEIVPTSAGSSGISATSWDDTGFDGTMVSHPGPSTCTCVGQGANDPFNTGHTQLTDRMMRHLRVCGCCT